MRNDHGHADAPPPGEFTYADAHGIEISVYEWQARATGGSDPIDAALTGPVPRGATPRRVESDHAAPIGVVQIAHGVGEHAKRYAGFAEALARAGFTVYADDHRGHGETGRRQWNGDLSRLGKLGPGGLSAAEAAIQQLTGIIRDRHPGLPLVMFGHSWGSLMTQRILNVAPRAWDAVILSGSALRTPTAMESGPLNARWKDPEANGFEWLSRDPAIAAAFLADPLCFAADIRKLFGLRDAMRLFGMPARGLAPDVPIHIVSGGDDPLHREGRHLQSLADAYRKRGVRDVTVKLYPGARHELLNETIRAEVYADLITWMLDRVA